MTLQEKIQTYSDMFKSKQRDNGENFVILKPNAPEELRESVRAAHVHKFPNDWIYGTYADLIQRLTDYEINSIDDVENYRAEIVDGYVDVYTAKLTKWLADDVSNVDYLTEAIDEYGNQKDGFQLLAMAQYRAIDEVYGYIINLLSK